MGLALPDVQNFFQALQLEKPDPALPEATSIYYDA